MSGWPCTWAYVAVSELKSGNGMPSWPPVRAAGRLARPAGGGSGSAGGTAQPQTRPCSCGPARLGLDGWRQAPHPPAQFRDAFALCPHRGVGRRGAGCLPSKNPADRRCTSVHGCNRACSSPDLRLPPCYSSAALSGQHLDAQGHVAGAQGVQLVIGLQPAIVVVRHHPARLQGHLVGHLRWRQRPPCTASPPLVCSQDSLSNVTYAIIGVCLLVGTGKAGGTARLLTSKRMAAELHDTILLVCCAAGESRVAT